MCAHTHLTRHPCLVYFQHVSVCTRFLYVSEHFRVCPYLMCVRTLKIDLHMMQSCSSVTGIVRNCHEEMLGELIRIPQRDYIDKNL